MEKALAVCNDSGQLLIPVKSAGINDLASNLQEKFIKFEVVPGIEDSLANANDSRLRKQG